jgi:hypothetical protein
MECAMDLESGCFLLGGGRERGRSDVITVLLVFFGVFLGGFFFWLPLGTVYGYGSAQRYRKLK